MNLVETVISTIAPHKCIICGVNGGLLCEPCRLSGLSTMPPRCYRCHAASAQGQVCQKCRKYTVLRHVWVASDYQDTAKELLRRLKFERASSAAEPIAAAIDNVLPDLPPGTQVVYIPTANSRVRIRGYDQAKLIAQKVARKRVWRCQALLMRKGSSRQVGSGRQDRFKQIESVLLPVKHDNIKGANILMIDDVTTTGATLEAAAKILKSAGAKTIDAAVFAQPV